MRDVLDTHTHTLASGHAYSTIRENARAAAAKGLELLAITEHAPCMPGTSSNLYFQNLRVVDRNAYEVPLLLGVELNILDFQGNVDLETSVLKGMDIAIASLHPPCIRFGGSREENTQAYLNVMKNPYVNIIGHPDDGRYPVDYLALVQGAKEYGKLLELNNSSLCPTTTRKNVREHALEYLKLCMEYEAPVVIGSDAHVDIDVGNHKQALALLEEIGFPEGLLINGDVERLKPYANAWHL